MSHKEQREFFEYAKNLMPQYFDNVSVIEMGSLNINGTVRDFYNAKKYVGVDLEEGPGVDFVSPAQEVGFEDNSFDVAVSAECFEHNPFWAETFENMYRIASAFVIFTCASDGREEHGTRRSHPSTSPFTLDWDYYKNLNEKDFRSKFKIDEMFNEYEFIYNQNSKDLYFWGII
jgi:ubiquinone/menaquinone biosynthesis C-methylase UbiE